MMKLTTNSSLFRIWTQGDLISRSIPNQFCLSTNSNPFYMDYVSNNFSTHRKQKSLGFWSDQAWSTVYQIQVQKWRNRSGCLTEWKLSNIFKARLLQNFFTKKFAIQSLSNMRRADLMLHLLDRQNTSC